MGYSSSYLVLVCLFFGFFYVFFDRNTDINTWIKEIELNSKDFTPECHIMAYLVPTKFELIPSDLPGFDAKHVVKDFSRINLTLVDGAELRDYYKCKLKIGEGQFVASKEIYITFRRLVEVDLRSANDLLDCNEPTELVIPEEKLQGSI